MKFTVGDRVSTREATTGDSPSGEIMTVPAGALGTVTSVDESEELPFPYGVLLDKYVQVDNRIWIFDDHELDHVVTEPEVKDDPVNHPAHYTWLPNGLEVIDVTENLNFNRGNAVKYIMRAEHKGNEIQDLEKAAWYVNREIERLTS